MLTCLSSKPVNTITWGHSNTQKSLRYNWSQNSKDSTMIFVFFYREIKSLLFYFPKATLSRQRIRFIICHSHKTLRVFSDSSTRAKLFQYVLRNGGRTIIRPTNRGGPRQLQVRELQLRSNDHLLCLPPSKSRPRTRLELFYRCVSRCRGRPRSRADGWLRLLRLTACARARCRRRRRSLLSCFNKVVLPER